MEIVRKINIDIRPSADQVAIKEFPKIERKHSSFQAVRGDLKHARQVLLFEWSYGHFATKIVVSSAAAKTGWRGEAANRRSLMSKISSYLIGVNLTKWASR